MRKEPRTPEKASERPESRTEPDGGYGSPRSSSSGYSSNHSSAESWKQSDEFLNNGDHFCLVHHSLLSPPRAADDAAGESSLQVEPSIMDPEDLSTDHLPDDTFGIPWNFQNHFSSSMPPMNEEDDDDINDISVLNQATYDFEQDLDCFMTSDAENDTETATKAKKSQSQNTAPVTRERGRGVRCVMAPSCFSRKRPTRQISAESLSYEPSTKRPRKLPKAKRFFQRDKPDPAATRNLKAAILTKLKDDFRAEHARMSHSKALQFIQTVPTIPERNVVQNVQASLAKTPVSVTKTATPASAKSTERRKAVRARVEAARGMRTDKVKMKARFAYAHQNGGEATWLADI